MYKRTTAAERHERKVLRFEMRHPRNKHVKARVAARAWAREMAHKWFTGYMTKLAARGDPMARQLMTAAHVLSDVGLPSLY